METGLGFSSSPQFPFLAIVAMHQKLASNVFYANFLYH